MPPMFNLIVAGVCMVILIVIYLTVWGQSKPDE